MELLKDESMHYERYFYIEMKYWATCMILDEFMNLDIFFKFLK
jgi:hypothetical protein